MIFLRKLALCFVVLYVGIVLHYALYDRASKQEALERVSSVMKQVEPAFSFRDDGYKRFVYAH